MAAQVMVLPSVLSFLVGILPVGRADDTLNMLEPPA